MYKYVNKLFSSCQCTRGCEKQKDRDSMTMSDLKVEIK